MNLVPSYVTQVTNTLESGAIYSTSVYEYKDHYINIDVWGSSVYDQNQKFLQNFRWKTKDASLMDQAIGFIDARCYDFN